MKSKSIVYNKAYKFSIRIVKAYLFLSKDKKEFILLKKLLRSGTSIAAYIAETNGVISDADFSNKISISYKECLETKYWLDLLKNMNYIEKNLYDRTYKDADEIAKMLFSIIKTTRISKN